MVQNIGESFHLPCFTSTFLIYTLSPMLDYSQLHVYHALLDTEVNRTLFQTLEESGMKM